MPVYQQKRSIRSCNFAIEAQADRATPAKLYRGSERYRLTRRGLPTIELLVFRGLGKVYGDAYEVRK
jgi:hypothetical protein